MLVQRLANPRSSFRPERRTGASGPGGTAAPDYAFPRINPSRRFLRSCPLSLCKFHTRFADYLFKRTSGATLSINFRSFTLLSLSLLSLLIQRCVVVPCTYVRTYIYVGIPRIHATSFTAMRGRNRETSDPLPQLRKSDTPADEEGM